MTATDRMQDSTAGDVQARIDERTRSAAVDALASGAIGERLTALEAEWDAERVLFTATGINVLLGLLLGWRVDRRWYAWVAGVGAFQLQHGLQGWCPPLAVIRRLGLRTRREIDEERHALKVCRGDYRYLDTGDLDAALDAVRR
jgi:hypothetical protein